MSLRDRGTVGNEIQIDDDDWEDGSERDFAPDSGSIEWFPAMSERMRYPPPAAREDDGESVEGIHALLGQEWADDEMLSSLMVGDHLSASEKCAERLLEEMEQAYSKLKNAHAESQSQTASHTAASDHKSIVDEFARRRALCGGRGLGVDNTGDFEASDRWTTRSSEEMRSRMRRRYTLWRYHFDRYTALQSKLMALRFNSIMTALESPRAHLVYDPPFYDGTEKQAGVGGDLIFSPPPPGDDGESGNTLMIDELNVRNVARLSESGGKDVVYRTLEDVRGGQHWSSLLEG